MLKTTNTEYLTEIMICHVSLIYEPKINLFFEKNFTLLINKWNWIVLLNEYLKVGKESIVLSFYF